MLLKNELMRDRSDYYIDSHFRQYAQEKTILFLAEKIPDKVCCLFTSVVVAIFFLIADESTLTIKEMVKDLADHFIHDEVPKIGRSSWLKNPLSFLSSEKDEN